ncbi:hypothetical protein FRB94_012146 [Tulasnella sp. JGI-2019a]|nr:hypothetical protein FRB94_012146 [Tulasnella sp. JGI-2019a]
MNNLTLTETDLGTAKLVLDLLPEGHPGRFVSLVKLACGLLTRHEQTGDRNDLDHGIDYNREALDLRPGYRSKLLPIIAISLRARFKQTGDRGDLHQTISCNKEVLDLLPEGDPI